MLTNNIRLIRKKWRYNQAEFGEIFELNRGNINSYENGYTEPNISFMVKLAQMSGISVEELYTQHIDNENIPDAPLEGAEGKRIRDRRKSSSEDGDDLRDYLNLMETVRDLRNRTQRLEDGFGEMSERMDKSNISKNKS